MLIGPVAQGDDAAYRAEVTAWRASREDDLRADDSWLTLAGLHWLKPGEARLGNDPACDIVLPESGPAVVGTLALADSHATLRLEPGVKASVRGKAFEGGELKTDAGGRADVLEVGPLRLIVIKRGDRYALRVKDNQSTARAAFTGLRWAPVDENWRIRAHFEPYATPKTIVFDTIVGGQDELPSPGEAVFEREGKTYRLQAAREGDHLWFVFRDATSGRTTHPGARQLEAAAADADGGVWLDFNKARNLPCAYTPYATCPLAPRQNRLDLRVEAGELLYKKAP